MKKIYSILLIMLALSFGLIACTEETPFLQQQKMMIPVFSTRCFPTA